MQVCIEESFVRLSDKSPILIPIHNMWLTQTTSPVGTISTLWHTGPAGQNISMPIILANGTTVLRQ